MHHPIHPPPTPTICLTTVLSAHIMDGNSANIPCEKRNETDFNGRVCIRCVCAIVAKLLFIWKPGSDVHGSEEPFVIFRLMSIFFVVKVLHWILFSHIREKKNDYRHLLKHIYIYVIWHCTQCTHADVIFVVELNAYAFDRELETEKKERRKWRWITERRPYTHV